MAIERQLAPFVDRLPLGGQDDVAVEDQPPGANALDDLGHTRRKPHQVAIFLHQRVGDAAFERSEEHTSELQSLMRISYAVFCLKKKITQNTIQLQSTLNTQTTIK